MMAATVRQKTPTRKANVAYPIEPDRIVSFQITPGSLDRFLETLAEGGPLVKCLEGGVTLVSPGRTHETSDRRLGLLIMAICEALKIPVSPLGSTLYKTRGDSGFEPDESYYIQSHGVASADQMPDLAIEIVTANPAKNALSIGERLGIPEMWVWDVPRRRLDFHHLERKGRGRALYQSRERSLAFPFLTPDDILAQVGEPVDPAAFDAVAFLSRSRAWARRVLLPRQLSTRKPS